MIDKAARGRWVLVALVWIIPVTFLLSGNWPLGLFPAILVTLWVFLTRRHAPRD